MRNIIGDMMNVPWWIRAMLGTVLLAVFLIGPSVVSKLVGFSTTREFYIYSFLSVLLIVALASVFGAFIGLLVAGHAFANADSATKSTIKGFVEDVNDIKNVQTTLSEHLRQVKGLTESLDNEISRSQEIVGIALERFGKSIVDYHDLLEIENSVEDGSEIWVLTSALELEDNELREIIRNNLRRGVKYTYLIVDDSLLKKQWDDLVNEWRTFCSVSPESQIKCLLVPKHFAYMTVIIYGPLKRQPIVLVKFPKSNIYQKDKYPFIYKVDNEPREAWHTFVECMQDLIGDGTHCPNVRAKELDARKAKA